MSGHSEKQGVIYGVRHKADVRICYVGQTKNEPEERWRAHASGNMTIARAVQMFGGRDEFELIVLERSPLDQLNARERYWIAELNTLHPNGLNRTSGGSKHAIVSDATKAKMAAAKKAGCSDPEYRAKLSERAKAMWASPEGRAKKRALWTPEKRALAAERAAALAADPQHMAKVTAGTKAALAADPEYRAKHSEGLKRRWADPEARAEQSAKLKAAIARKKAGGAHVCTPGA